MRGSYMKRLASLVVLCTAALLISPSLYAQRGMSGRGGGGGGSFHGGGGFRSAPSGGFRSAGPSGFRSAPSGFRSGPGFSTFGPVQRSGGFSSFAPSNRAFSSRSFSSRGHVFVNRPFVNRPFGFRRFHNNFGFFNGCFGCFSPFLFSGGFFLGSPFYSSPGFYGDYYGDGYGYSPPAPQPVVVNTDNGNSAELAAQVQQLTDEVSDLRSEENRRYYDDRAKASSGATLSATEPAAATIFVFTDGHRISAKSYAIAGQTLWIFSEQSARKYPLTELDAGATEQANAANGVEFHLPAAKH
ncbi:MAG: hypothetical protein ACJ71W_01425 [Terriglobales bacterium]